MGELETLVGHAEVVRYAEFSRDGHFVVTASSDGDVRRWPLEPLAPERAGEVASRYRYSDGAGEVGVIHAVRNVGTSNAAELATYVVEKGKPLLTLAE